MHHHVDTILDRTDDHQIIPSSNKRRRIQTSGNIFEEQSQSCCNESPTSSSNFPNINEPNIYINGSSSISMIDSTPDIFLHIMSYFVGPPSTTIDSQSILAMMQVNKLWNELTNLKCIWKNVPKYQSQTDYSPLETRLLGYCKLQKLPNHENCWKVRERGTGKVLRLEITTLYTEYSDSYHKRHLREISIHETMKYIEEQDKCHLNLLQDFDYCNGYSLHWHNYPDDTLDTYLRKNDLKSRPDIIKQILFQIVHGVMCLHRNGIAHGKLTADAVHVFQKDGSDFTLPMIQIANFDRCRDHLTLEADNCFQYQDMIPLPEGRYNTTGIPADVYAVGRIFVSMLHGQLFTYLDDIEDVLKSHYVYNIVGSDGMHLLNGLLCRDPLVRISILEAFQHPYFSNIRRVRDDKPSCPLSPNHVLHKVRHLQKMEEEYHASQRTPRIRFETHQAAAMVDWLFEIASVFHLNTKTVFLAVGYYNQCCHQSVIRTLLDTTTQVGSEKIQLLAATCLYIASKCEDDFHVQCGNLVFSADRTFHLNDVIGLELKILSTIEWKLPVPTIYDFVTSYMTAIDIEMDSPIFWLSLYISELALASTMHTEFAPSMVAACALILSQYSLKTQYIWSTKLESTTGYKWEELSNCLLALSTLLKTRHDFQEVSIIDRRYHKLSRMNASDIAIRVIDSSLHLEAMRSMVQIL